MELILWRHADAGLATAPAELDTARPLSAKGRKQASKMAKWLDDRLPEHCRILVSPAIRTVQTAQALGRPFHVHDALAPDAGTDAVLNAVGWPDGAGTVLIVGHQPTLGRIVALLVAGQEQDWTLRKGSICWIVPKTLDDRPRNHIRILLGPDMVGSAQP